MDAIGGSRRFHVTTFGCQMNEHDSERIGGMLRADGMTPTDDVGDARVIVLNTCAIRENADHKLYGNLGHLKPIKAANPELRIVVSGCLAQKDQGEIQRRAPWVDVVVGTHALPHLLELLERAEREGPQMDVGEYTETFPSALPAARDDDFRAWVSMAPGCDNACTFCIVPLVRGPQSSRPIGDILAAARRGVHVRLVIADKAHANAVTYRAFLSRYDELLAAGVEIWEYPAVVHAKVIVSDERVLIGTLNLDAWALYRNPEMGLLFDDAVVAERMVTTLFEPDIANSVAGRPATGRFRRARNRAFARANYIL